MGLDFDERGFLPAGVHDCDETLFNELLVDDFPGDMARASIRDGFFEFRRRAAGHGLAACQWVDGSFVTTKAAPGDVDVVNFVRKENLAALSGDAKLFVRETMAGPEGKRSFKTHSFVVAWCAPDDPHFVRYENARRYWRRWLGHTRPLPTPSGGERPGLPKGILRMSVGAEDEVPDVPRSEVP